MTASKKAESPLLVAARELAEGLSTFESLSEDLGRVQINSDKSLRRAQDGLAACAAHETRLAEHLRAFAGAMQSIQATQQRCVELIAQAAEHTRRRQEQRFEIQERLAALSERAREVSARVVGLLERLGQGTAGDVIGPLHEVEQHLDAVIAEAGEVTALARRDEWSDFERDTHGLEQQLQAMKNRVSLCRRKLAVDAPS